MLKTYTKSLVYILIVFWGSSGILEVMARSQFADQNLLTPGLTVDTTSIDVQMDLMDKLSAQHDQIDCIIVGSSVGASAINPIYLAQSYQAQTGKEFICFNFSSPGLRADSVAVLSDYLVKKYKPTYLIYAVSPIGFSPNTSNGNTLLQESSWFRYVGYHDNLEGGFIEYSQAYRYYLRYQEWLSPNFSQVTTRVNNLGRSINKYGYSGVGRNILDIRQPVADSNGIQDIKMTNDVMINYEVADIHQKSFQKILDLNRQHDTQIIIIDMPLHASFIGYFPNLSVDYQIYLDTIQQMSVATNVPLWHLSSANFIPDEYWRDRHHMNPQGAIYFSYWLGTQFGLSLTGTDEQEALFSGPAPDMMVLPTEILSEIKR